MLKRNTFSAFCYFGRVSTIQTGTIWYYTGQKSVSLSGRYSPKIPKFSTKSFLIPGSNSQVLKMALVSYWNVYNVYHGMSYQNYVKIECVLKFLSRSTHWFFGGMCTISVHWKYFIILYTKSYNFSKFRAGTLCFLKPESLPFYCLFFLHLLRNFR